MKYVAVFLVFLGSAITTSAWACESNKTIAGHTADSLKNLPQKELYNYYVELNKFHKENGNLRRQNKMSAEEFDACLIELSQNVDVLEVEVMDRVENYPPTDTQTSQEKRALKKLKDQLKGLEKYRYNIGTCSGIQGQLSMRRDGSCV